MKCRKYIHPEKRLKRYEDYGYRKFPDNIKRVKFTKFKIVVPTKKDKEQLQAAFEYLHNRDIDTDFIAVNQVVHEYDYGEPSKPDNIIIDKNIFNSLNTNEK